MKKNTQILFLLAFCFGNAQVGINNDSPSAAVDIVSKGNTSSTKALEVNNTSSKELFTILDNGNVGIGVSNPEKSLHIDANNQSLKIDNLIREVPENYDILTRNTTTGDITATPYVYNANTGSLASGASKTITIPSNINLTSGMLIIKSYNGCGRNMISTFAFNDTTLGYVSGVARDKVGTPSISPIAGGSSASGTWSVKFPDVLACSNDGNGTQFDFTIVKPSANSITITNNGNVARTYAFTLFRM